MDKRAQRIERQKGRLEQLNNKLFNDTQLGKADKAKEWVSDKVFPISKAISGFGDRYGEIIESLKETDNKARESALDLKYFLKDAKGNVNRLEYMAAIVDLGQFHTLLEEIVETFKSFENDCNDVHNEFLFGGDYLSDERKKFLYTMPEKHKKKEKKVQEKKAGVADWWHNLTSDRGRALKEWNKKFPAAAKELNRQTSKMIARSEQFLNFIDVSFKTLAKYRTSKSIEAYLKVAGSIVQKFVAYDEAFNEFFNGTAQKYIARQQAFEAQQAEKRQSVNEQAADQLRTMQETTQKIVQEQEGSAAPEAAPQEEAAPDTTRKPQVNTLAPESSTPDDIDQAIENAQNGNIPQSQRNVNAPQMIGDDEPESQPKPTARIMALPAGPKTTMRDPQETKSAQQASLPFAKTLPSIKGLEIEEPEWEEVTEDDLFDDTTFKNLNNPRIPTMVDEVPNSPTMMSFRGHPDSAIENATNPRIPTIPDTEPGYDTEVPAEYHLDTEFPMSGETMPSPSGMKAVRFPTLLPTPPKVPQDLLRDLTDQEMVDADYWYPRGKGSDTLIPTSFPDKIVDEEPLTQAAPKTLQYPFGTQEIMEEGPLTEADPKTMQYPFGATAAAFVAKLDSMTNQNSLVVAKEIIAYAKSIEKSDKATSIRLLKVAQQLIKQ